MCGSLAHPSAPRGRAKRGFTLIELLVVIAIIALLVSILLPSIRKAKRLAQLVVCESNFHGIGRGASMYASDYDGYIPTADYEYGGDYYLFWALRLAGYLGLDPPTGDDARSTDVVSRWVTAQDFFHCPGIEAAGKEEGVDYTVNDFDWEAYRYNIRHGYTDNPYKHPDAMRRARGPRTHAVRPGRAQVAPATLLYLCEADRRHAIRVANMGHDSHCVFNRQGNPAGTRMIKHTDMRHDGKTAFLCFDGHAEVREMIPENFPMSLYVPNHE